MQAQAHVATSGSTPSNSALISAKTIQGTKVYSPTGDDLGHIDDVMVDAATGKVVYGVLQFGGFLGIGADHYPIPFGRLNFDAARGGYTTDIARADLEGAPVPDEDWSTDREWQKRSHDHYRVHPYWF